MLGVRLDSGDLVELSREARRMLDEAGFPEAAIVASGDLDEYAIGALKKNGAQITVWGVGTKLVTAYDDPSLGGVYKLAAIRDEDGAWSDRVKLSDDVGKTSNPGVQQVRRLRRRGRFVGDVIYDERLGLSEPVAAVSLSTPEQEIPLPAGAEGEDLLQPVFRDGVCLHEPPTIEEARAHAQDQLRMIGEAEYPVGLDARLHKVKQRLMAKHGVTAVAD